jgi:hypothetical protein
MARVMEPPPGKLILSIIYTSMDALADCLKTAERRFGRVQFETAEINCAVSKRYEEEMGHNISRRFFSFEQLTPRSALTSIKGICHKIEPNFADHVDGFHFRTVNIDPGILTPNNLVMASHHEYGHSIYLTNGVYNELMLVWSQGRFVRLPWTPTDFFENEAVDLFERVRSSFGLVAESA